MSLEEVKEVFESFENCGECGAKPVIFKTSAYYVGKDGALTETSRYDIHCSNASCRYGKALPPTSRGMLYDCEDNWVSMWDGILRR